MKYFSYIRIKDVNKHGIYAMHASSTIEKYFMALIKFQTLENWSVNGRKNWYCEREKHFEIIKVNVGEIYFNIGQSVIL